MTRDGGLHGLQADGERRGEEADQDASRWIAICVESKHRIDMCDYYNEANAQRTDGSQAQGYTA